MRSDEIDDDVVELSDDEEEGDRGTRGPQVPYGGDEMEEEDMPRPFRITGRFISNTVRSTEAHNQRLLSSMEASGITAEAQKSALEEDMIQNFRLKVPTRPRTSQRRSGADGGTPGCEIPSSSPFSSRPGRTSGALSPSPLLLTHAMGMRSGRSPSRERRSPSAHLQPEPPEIVAVDSADEGGGGSDRLAPVASPPLPSSGPGPSSSRPSPSENSSFNLACLPAHPNAPSASAAVPKKPPAVTVSRGAPSRRSIFGHTLGQLAGGGPASLSLSRGRRGQSGAVPSSTGGVPMEGGEEEGEGGGAKRKRESDPEDTAGNGEGAVGGEGDGFGVSQSLAHSGANGGPAMDVGGGVAQFQGSAEGGGIAAVCEESNERGEGRGGVQKRARTGEKEEEEGDKIGSGGRGQMVGTSGEAVRVRGRGVAMFGRQEFIPGTFRSEWGGQGSEEHGEFEGGEEGEDEMMFGRERDRGSRSPFRSEDIDWCGGGRERGGGYRDKDGESGGQRKRTPFSGWALFARTQREQQQQSVSASPAPLQTSSFSSSSSFSGPLSGGMMSSFLKGRLRSEEGEGGWQTQGEFGSREKGRLRSEEGEGGWQTQGEFGSRERERTPEQPRESTGGRLRILTQSGNPLRSPSAVHSHSQQLQLQSADSSACTQTRPRLEPSAVLPVIVDDSDEEKEREKKRERETPGYEPGLRLVVMVDDDPSDDKGGEAGGVVSDSSQFQQRGGEGEERKKKLQMRPRSPLQMVSLALGGGRMSSEQPDCPQFLSSSSSSPSPPPRSPHLVPGAPSALGASADGSASLSPSLVPPSVEPHGGGGRKTLKSPSKQRTGGNPVNLIPRPSSPSAPSSSTLRLTPAVPPPQKIVMQRRAETSGSVPSSSLSPDSEMEEGGMVSGEAEGQRGGFDSAPSGSAGESALYPSRERRAEEQPREAARQVDKDRFVPSGPSASSSVQGGQRRGGGSGSLFRNALGNAVARPRNALGGVKQPLTMQPAPRQQAVSASSPSPPGPLPQSNGGLTLVENGSGSRALGGQGDGPLASSWEARTGAGGQSGANGRQTSSQTGQSFCLLLPPASSSSSSNSKTS